jgi:hypothetical protein
MRFIVDRLLAWNYTETFLLKKSSVAKIALLKQISVRIGKSFCDA